MNLRTEETKFRQEEQNTKFQNTVIYVLGTLEELKDKGLIIGPNNLTKKGKAEAKKLIDSGWTPDDEYMKSVLYAVTEGLLGTPEEKPKTKRVAKKAVK